MCVVLFQYTVYSIQYTVHRVVASFEAASFETASLEVASVEAASFEAASFEAQYTVHSTVHGIQYTVWLQHTVLGTP